MNYSQLVTALQDYLVNDEPTFVTHIPDIVRSAEEDIYFNTQLPSLRKNSTGSLTEGNQYLSLPSDFLSVYSLAVVDDDAGTHNYLVNKEVDFIREAFPDEDSQDIPAYYALFDNNTVIVGPTPDFAYTVELHYFYKPDSIVTTSTSWIGDNAPNCLLYGSLLHGYTYMKGEQDMLAVYQNEYSRALANLQTITEGRARKDTYRTPNKRVDI